MIISMIQYLYEAVKEVEMISHNPESEFLQLEYLDATVL
jgi:hypothetical protein